METTKLRIYFCYCHTLGNFAGLLQTEGCKKCSFPWVMFEFVELTLVQKVAIRNSDVIDRKTTDIWISGGLHKIKKRYFNEIAHVNKTGYSRCGDYQGIAGPLDKIIVHCKPPMTAKHSIIQPVHGSGLLHILEVTFYARCKFLSNNWSRKLISI